MKVNLSIQEKLKDLRVERGLSLEEAAQATGISKSTLDNYEQKDDKDISHTYLLELAKFYDVSADWLLGISESREILNHDIADLHLDDETLDILKSGRLNNRLLCEIIKHPMFLKLMADAEIYIDGIASMNIKSLNDWVNIMRRQVVQQHNPDTDDKYLRILEAACIDEEEFFFHNIHNDLDSVIRTIRQEHEKDFESAPIEQPSYAKKIQNFIKTLSYKANPLEETTKMIYEILGINRKKLTDEEDRIFKQILKKAKKLYIVPSHKHKARKK